jgi:hypothetical protein
MDIRSHHIRPYWSFRRIDEVGGARPGWCGTM